MDNSKMHLRLDPWSADYDASIQFELVEQESSAEVDPSVETSDWRAIRPKQIELGRDLFFVDGVRRVEARVLADHENCMVNGLFGSIAVGGVRSSGQIATFEKILIRRFLILGHGFQHIGELVHTDNCEILFEGYSTPQNSPLDVLRTLQNLMRQAEVELAEGLVPGAGCVFADGPLTYFSLAKQEIVGVIKRLYLPYLSADYFGLVPKLSAGERTPLFTISDGKYDRYSWFLRGAMQRPIDHFLAGVLRLEVRAGAGLEKAKDLADLSAVHLPRFASSPIRDPRAPQNLFPVGALEPELRRHMGDALIIRRAIERKLFEGVSS